jgi:VWFA-related protein
MHSDFLSRRDVMMGLLSAFPAARLLGAPQEPKFSTDVKVVNVFTTVHDKHGKVVSNLQNEDFALEEDGRQQPIRYFSRETDLPLTLGLLVDTSMSQRRVLGEERTASYRFFDRVLREDKDQAFVIHFDREIELLQDLTSSRKKLETALGQLELSQQDRPQWGGGGQGGGGNGGGNYPGGGGGGQGRGGGRGHHGGGTTLYDAVLLASDEVMKKQTGRKALVVLSDGVDTGSKVPMSQAIESAERADTLVYSILFADPEGYRGAGQGGFGGYGGRGGMGRRGGMSRYPQQERPDDKKVLHQISRETGGGFFEVSKKLPIDQIYDQIQEELRSQYSLGFTPDPNAGSGFRKISVTTKQKDLVVRAREGYYPAP